MATPAINGTKLGTTILDWSKETISSKEYSRLTIVASGVTDARHFLDGVLVPRLTLIGNPANVEMQIGVKSRVICSEAVCFISVVRSSPCD